MTEHSKNVQSKNLKYHDYHCVYLQELWKWCGKNRAIIIQCLALGVSGESSSTGVGGLLLESQQPVSFLTKPQESKASILSAWSYCCNPTQTQERWISVREEKICTVNIVPEATFVKTKKNAWVWSTESWLKKLFTQKIRLLSLLSCSILVYFSWNRKLSLLIFVRYM